MGENVQLFENQPIRAAWDEEQGEWYFSVVDVVGVLTEQDTPRGASNYWAKLKERLKKEGCNELLTNCQQLKMKAADGKKRLTDVADTEQLFRIIQSIPSPKAEPFKMWLAQVGRERIEETIDPEQTIDRALDTYLKKGYSREWINQRLQAIQVRKELTDEWHDRGVKPGKEYAILTDEITRAWSGMSTREYKNFKGLKKENLRDNMSTTEIVLNMLAETATKEISKQTKPDTFDANKSVAKRGGGIAGNARKELELETGKSVITSQNAKELNGVVMEMLETVVDTSTSTPTLETDRLRLRPFQKEDAEDVFECWESDPDVAKYMFWTSHNDIEKTREWIAFELGQIEKPDWYRFAIVLRESNTLIGTALIYYEEEVKCWEIGYNLGKKYWGKGYTTEAMEKVIDFAEKKLKLTQIVGRYAKENPASGNVMKKLGFQYEKDIPYECNDGAVKREGIQCRLFLKNNR